MTLFFPQPWLAIGVLTVRKDIGEPGWPWPGEPVPPPLGNWFPQLPRTDLMLFKVVISYDIISYLMINYVKKFEGHKPGPEKIENDPSIFRYRISFLIAVDTFQRILLFSCVFKQTRIFIPNYLNICLFVVI